MKKTPIVKSVSNTSVPDFPGGGAAGQNDRWRASHARTACRMPFGTTAVMIPKLDRQGILRAVFRLFHIPAIKRCRKSMPFDCRPPPKRGWGTLLSGTDRVHKNVTA